MARIEWDKTGENRESSKENFCRLNLYTERKCYEYDKKKLEMKEKIERYTQGND